MLEEDIITDDSLPSEAESPAVASDDENILSLDELKNVLGKDFPTKDAALKSIKDTYKAVVEKKEKIAQEVKQEVDTSQFATKEEIAQLRKESFYAKHPEYQPFDELIDALATKTGLSYNEVVGGKTFKEVYEKVEAAEKVAKSKSVLQSNNRIGADADFLSKARKAVDEARKAKQDGDVTSQMKAQERADKAAVRAVMEAFEKR